MLLFQFIKKIRSRIRILSVLVLYRNAEILIGGQYLEGRLGDVFIVLNLIRARAASAGGVEVDGICLRALDINSAVFVVELVYLGTRRCVAVACLDSVQNIFVRQGLRLDHRPRLEEMDGAVVVITANAGNSLAEAEHLIVDVGRVIHIRAAVRCAVVDLEHIEIFKL